MLFFITTALAGESTFYWDPSIHTPLTLGSGVTWALLYTQVEDDVHPQGAVSSPIGMDAWVTPRLNGGAHTASDVVMYGTIGAGLGFSIADGLLE